MKTIDTLAALDLVTLDTVHGGDYASKVKGYFSGTGRRIKAALHHGRHGDVKGYVKNSAAATIDIQHGILSVAGDAYKQFH